VYIKPGALDFRGFDFLPFRTNWLIVGTLHPLCYCLKAGVAGLHRRV